MEDLSKLTLRLQEVLFRDNTGLYCDVTEKDDSRESLQNSLWFPGQKVKTNWPWENPNTQESRSIWINRQSGRRGRSLAVPKETEEGWKCSCCSTVPPNGNWVLLSVCSAPPWLSHQEPTCLHSHLISLSYIFISLGIPQYNAKFLSQKHSVECEGTEIFQQAQQLPSSELRILLGESDGIWVLRFGLLLCILLLNSVPEGPDLQVKSPDYQLLLWKPCSLI